MLKHLKTISLLLIAVLILGGCILAPKYEYSDIAIPLSQISSTKSIGIGVQDARPYVLSGKKSEKFVGLTRGGFNNPYDIDTQSGNPLAIDLRDDIIKAMQHKGIAVIPTTIGPFDNADKVKNILIATQAKKLVLVTINQWESDSGFPGTRLKYDLALTVMDSQGNKLATNQISGKEYLGAYAMSHTINEKLKANFSRKIEVLFDNNDKVIAALK